MLFSCCNSVPDMLFIIEEPPFKRDFMNISSIITAGVMVCCTLATTNCNDKREAEAAKYANLIVRETLATTDESTGVVLSPEQKLAVACAYNNAEAVRTLLQQGVNPNAMVETIVPGQTPEDLQQRSILFHAMNHWTLSTETMEIMITAGAVPTDELLFHAISNRNDEWVELLLRYGANPNARHSLLEEHAPEHALLEAAYASDRGESKAVERMVMHLLNYGADAHVRTTGGNTALHAAVSNAESARLIKALLDKGVDINATNNKGETPLMVAAGNKNHSLYRLLLKHGANPALRNNRGQTAADILHYTPPADYERLSELAYPVHYNEEEATRLLAAGGLDINRDYGKGTLLQRAIAYGYENVEMLKLLLKHGAKTEFDNGKPSALHIAVYYRENFEIAHILLEHGASTEGVKLSDLIFTVKTEADLNTAIQRWVSISEIKTEHVLHLAKNTHPELLKKLLQQGLSIAPQDTTIMAAAQTCFYEEDNLLQITELLQMLYDAGADPNAADKNGKTALMSLRANRHSDLLPKLVSLGADLNRQDVAGNTALHYLAIQMADCVSEDGVRMAKEMIRYGANPHIKNKRGETPRDTAIRHHKAYHLFSLLHQAHSLKYDTPWLDKNGKPHVLNPEEYLLLLEAFAESPATTAPTP